jgi:predicted nucleic acid-binding protein
MLAIDTNVFVRLVLETARKNGHLPLGTFDRGLAKQADVERLTDRR